MGLTKAKRIFVSNRLPFNMDSQTKTLRRGSGGLVSALLGVRLDQPFYWLGFETNSETAQLLKEKAPDVDEHLRLSPVVIDQKLYESYYDRFSNDVLWPLFHYESHHVLFHQKDWKSYISANEMMAEAILNIAESGDTVWVHDFHFLLLPQLLKSKKPDLKIGFFLHTPFPSSEIFRQLPVREELLKSWVQADLIGFHEHSYLRHFNVTLKSHIGQDTSLFKAQIGSHTLNMGVYPISIDQRALKQKSNSEEVKKKTGQFESTLQSPFLILGVDRLDYSKGLELKLKGFRRLLQKYPELRGKVNLLQVAVPTRTNVPAYAQLKEEIDQLVGNINGEFARPGYVPVQYIFNSVSETDLLALYQRANSVLITSKRDGMNLVAMEYVVAQRIEKPGVLILSEFTGAATLLSQSLFVNPWDEDSIADRIHQAFKMPEEERVSRMQGLQEVLSKYSATQWAHSFLKDLEKEEKKPTLTKTQNLTKDLLTLALSKKTKKLRHFKIILDYDGTLVSLQNRPELAIVSADLRQQLEKLNQILPVCIVSGRNRSFLDHQFPNCPFYLVAEHGAFFKAPGRDWQSRMTSDVRVWYDEVNKVMTAYSEYVPFSFVEYKEAGIVWHYRMSPAEIAQYQARKLDEELQVGLANLPVSISAGKKIIEAKAIECNKGLFARWLLKQDPESFLICIGDDQTDEDMFKAVGSKGLSIKVGSGETAAQFRVEKQFEVFELLKSLQESVHTLLPQ